MDGREQQPAWSIQGTRPAVAPGGMIGPASRKSRPPGCLILPSCRGCEEARAAAPGCLIEERPAPRLLGCPGPRPHGCQLLAPPRLQGSPGTAPSWWPCMNESGCSPVALVGSWRMEEPRRCWCVSPNGRAARAEAVSIQEPARPVASRAILTRHLLQNL